MELFGAPRANSGAVSRMQHRPILLSLHMLSGWVIFETTNACRWVPKEIDLEPFARWLPKEGSDLALSDVPEFTIGVRLAVVARLKVMRSVWMSREVRASLIWMCGICAYPVS